MTIVSRRRTSSALLFSLFLLLTLFSLQARAQEQEEGAGASSQSAERQEVNRQNNRSSNLIRALNLSPEQVERIKAIQEQSRAEQPAAAARLRRALRELDRAIYADTIDEAVIEERMREVASARAGVVRTRTMTELNIRRLLTPDQLNTFRKILQQARRRAQRNRRLQQQQNQRMQNDANKPLLRSPLPKQQHASPQNDGNNQPPALAPRAQRGALSPGQRP